MLYSNKTARKNYYLIGGVSCIMKTFLFTIASASLLGATPLTAEDNTALFIFKQDGEMPKVEAEGVDRFGAATVHDMLGENYVVFHGSRADLTATSPHPVQPVVPDDFPDDSPLPLCQCPEDYTAGLLQRFSTPEMQDLLQQSRTLVAPSELPTLRVDQAQALEQWIQGKGPVILKGQ
ncbi:MAG: hypothetical protein ACRBBQ_15875 [Cognatishimia sp.]